MSKTISNIRLPKDMDLLQEDFDTDKLYKQSTTNKHISQKHNEQYKQSQLH